MRLSIHLQLSLSVVSSAEIDLASVEMVDLRQIPHVGLVRTLMTFIECEKVSVDTYIEEGRKSDIIYIPENIYYMGSKVDAGLFKEIVGGFETWKKEKQSYCQRTTRLVEDCWVCVGVSVCGCCV